VRTDTRKPTGNGAYKHNVQSDVDVGTARNGVSRLHRMVSGTVFMMTTEYSLPQEKPQKMRVAKWKERRHHRHIVLRDTHMEVGLDKRILADRNVHGRIYRRILIRGSCVAENGKIIKVAEISTRGSRTNPCLRHVRLRRRSTQQE
jgi:hypothetical protein